MAEWEARVRSNESTKNHLASPGDDVVPLPHHGHDRARAHVVQQLLKKVLHVQAGRSRENGQKQATSCEVVDVPGAQERRKVLSMQTESCFHSQPPLVYELEGTRRVVRVVPTHDKSGRNLLLSAYKKPLASSKDCRLF